jgi:hypothetical protein
MTNEIKPTPEIQPLLTMLWHYETASAMIAHAEFSGYDCEKVFKVLTFFQEMRSKIKADVLALDPDAFTDGDR